MAILIGDASPIIGFTAANEHQLLIDVLTATYGRIEVPHHVDGEISLKSLEKSRKARSNYDWMKSRGHVHVYPEAFASGPGQSIAVLAAGLLDTLPGAIGSRQKDGGEAFAVAHAVAAKQAGACPDLLMDDITGTKWATKHQIGVHRTEWVFEQAKTQGLITTKAAMAHAYNGVRQHTGALPLLASTDLLTGLP